MYLVYGKKYERSGGVSADLAKITLQSTIKAAGSRILVCIQSLTWLTAKEHEIIHCKRTSLIIAKKIVPEGTYLFDLICHPYARSHIF
jgi:hypothetical protein